MNYNIILLQMLIVYTYVKLNWVSPGSRHGGRVGTHFIIAFLLFPNH